MPLQTRSTRWAGNANNYLQIKITNPTTYPTPPPRLLEWTGLLGEMKTLLPFIGFLVIVVLCGQGALEEYEREVEIKAEAESEAVDKFLATLKD